MADEELQARLQSHSKAFEGLMSLIPAKVYYGEDNEDQWKRKKQTKEEKRAAKKAKLDPASNKSALDIQNEKKRKREPDMEDDVDLSTLGVEQPRQGLKSAKNAAKKPKLNDYDEAKVPKSDKPPTEKSEAERKAYADKRKEKRERKKEKKAKLVAKKQGKAEGVALEAEVEKSQNSKVTTASGLKDSTSKKPLHSNAAKPTSQAPKQAPADTKESPAEAAEDDEFDEDVSDEPMEDGIAEEAEVSEAELEAGEGAGEDQEEGEDNGAADLAPLDFSGLVAEESAMSDISDEESLTFDNAQESSASSASSILPEASAPAKQALSTTETLDDHIEDSTAPSQPREKFRILPQIDTQILQERLQARLTALRAARKADGIDGKPARNRQELIEGRRKKEEQRKAHKKELRTKAKLAQDAETEAARLRGGSGSPMWSPGTFSPREPENNFSFGRVAFEDGAAMDASLSTVLDPKKKRGPQDVKTALEAAQHKRARINGLDEAKRADIEDKDRWLNAKKRINGEKVRDDTNLLKKTLKRKEKVKTKSEKEWTERIETVAHGKEMRQKKREDNLQKRKEEKGQKGKKKKLGGKPKNGPVKKRPGFEGSFRAGGGRPKA